MSETAATKTPATKTPAPKKTETPDELLVRVRAAMDAFAGPVFDL